MNEPSAISAEQSERMRPWPKVWLVISALLWVAAWEVIVWFVPIQPRLVIRTDNPETETSEFLAGFSPDGKMLVTFVGDRDPALPGTIFHLWDIKTGQDLVTLGSEEKNILPNVVYSCQRNLLDEIIFPFNASDDYVLRDLAERQDTRRIQIDRGPNSITAVCFSNDGRTLACCINSNDKGNLNLNDKGDLKLIDVATGQVRAHLEGGPYGTWAGFVFSQDGSTLATTETKPNQEGNIGDDVMVIVLDTRTGKKKMVFQDCGPTIFLSLSPDGSKLAGHCLIDNPQLDDHSRVKVWDVATGKQIASLKDHGLPELLPDGKSLAMRDQDSLRFCDTTSGKEFAAVKVSSSFVTWAGSMSTGLIPVPDSHLLTVLACCESKPGPLFQWCSTFLGTKGLSEERHGHEVAFFDIGTGEKVASITRPRIGVVQVFPDGKSLALETTKNDESRIELWDIPPRKPLRWVLGLLAIPSVVTAVTLWRCWKARSVIEASKALRSGP
jgi:WD40 repeat protein